MKRNENARRAFAIALQEAMDGLHLRPSDLAKLMHVTPNRARIWIDEGITPQSAYYFKICEEFGFDPAEFGFELHEKKLDLEPITPEEYGRIFAVSRMKQQLTQQFVASWSGVHFVTLSRIEGGLALPHERTVTRLCEVLGLDEEEMQTKRLCAMKGASEQKKCR